MLKEETVTSRAEKILNGHLIPNSKRLQSLARLEKGLPADDPEYSGPFRLHSETKDFTLEGCRRQYEGITTKVIRQTPARIVYGERQYYRIKQGEEKKKFEHYVASNPGLPKSIKPFGKFLENIAQAKARVLLSELEARELLKRIKDLEALEEKQRKLQVEKLRYKGIGKIRGGVLVQMDGRKIVQRDGQDVFEDDGSDVVNYLAQLKKRKKQKSANKRAVASRSF
jgi:hypothetical protein